MPEIADLALGDELAPAYADALATMKEATSSAELRASLCSGRSMSAGTA
ncbi:hypothetical protein [Tessaracoccus defluvii]|nr:hypothetical protein [Tessaracoccus defluvii]